MIFNDFVQKHSLKIQAKLNIKIQQVISSLFLKDVRLCLRDGPFSSDIGIENLHPSKGTHWVCYINENYWIAMVVHLQINYLNLI